jgi:hypothetical protein
MPIVLNKLRICSVGIQITTRYSINNKIIIFFFVVICLLTPLSIGIHSNDDYCSLVDSSLFIEDDSFLESFVDSLSPGIIENNIFFDFCLAFTFFIQPEETLQQNLSISSISLNRAPPLSLPV